LFGASPQLPLQQNYMSDPTKLIAIYWWQSTEWFNATFGKQLKSATFNLINNLAIIPQLNY